MRTQIALLQSQIDCSSLTKVYNSHKLFAVAMRLLISISILLLVFFAEAREHTKMHEVCRLIGNKLSSVSVQECLDLQLVETGVYTQHGRAILYKEYSPLVSRQPLARVLFIGGIHGDEYASFSVAFKWMTILDRHHSGLFHWHFAPAINLDGLLQNPATRTNANQVDLNRNLASADWTSEALSYWAQQTNRNTRRYPGPSALSENESRWLADEIKNFQPDVIVSLHAPYGLVDYDGPASVKPPASLGSLNFSDLKTFPGSLGRYAGEDLAIPVLTIELKSSRYMPSDHDLRTMWVDLVRWLRHSIPQSD